jgi:hypothetical protein
MSTPSTPRGTVTQAGDVKEHGLSAPTAIGKWKTSNFTNQKTVVKVKARALLHSTVEASNVEFEWISPYKLKYRVAWPKWFQYPEQMCKFHVDERGELIYHEGHSLTIDFAERNASITEEDERIYDTGYLKFNSPMKTALEDLEHNHLGVEIVK